MTARSTITFRAATMADADALLVWRNDPGTRVNSMQTDLVTPDVHQRWLRDSLQSSDRELWIACEMDQPVGTIRLDRHEGKTWELSWTVAPDARGRGVGAAMVSAAVVRAARPLIARIRLHAGASMKVAQAAGFAMERREGNITWWRLPLV